MLFGVYQGWVHKNIVNHLDGGITEDGKWQGRWEKLVCLPTQHYNAPSGKTGRFFSQPSQRSLMEYELGSGTPSG